ncbi:Pycsar system effector family protein [Micromonospora sp. NPDC000207]|uniref:Pycsar system effector family protein n=1 Tax=Micromonospora sp. NPDC000207 TaxID=3154246 RepID=UPI0033343B5A
MRMPPLVLRALHTLHRPDPGPDQPVQPERTLTPFEDLQVAMNVTASFQTAIQQADAKAGMLIAVHTGLLALVATTTGDTVRRLVLGDGPTSWATVAAWTALAVFTAATVAGGTFLFQTVRPRLSPPGPENRFAFPSVRPAGQPVGAQTAAQLCAQAWQHTATVAEIALAKHRHIRRALRCLPVMLLSGVPLLWLAPPPG